MCIPPVSRLHGGPGGPGASSRAATQQETKSRKGNILGGTMAATTSFCEDRRGKLWDQSLFLFPPCRPFILPAREDARPPGRVAEQLPVSGRISPREWTAHIQCVRDCEVPTQRITNST